MRGYFDTLLSHITGSSAPFAANGGGRHWLMFCTGNTMYRTGKHNVSLKQTHCIAQATQMFHTGKQHVLYRQKTCIYQTKCILQTNTVYRTDNHKTNISEKRLGLYLMG